MLDDSLIAAYRATDYVLFDVDGAELTLNIGRSNAALDQELERRGATTAVVVTAYNPRSVVLPDLENRTRHRALVGMIEASGYDFALGEGRDPTGRWAAEVECIVFGIAVEAGLDLARAFDQNAIVFVRRGAAPELVYPDLG